MNQGIYWKTKKRKVGMYLFGSTITATRYPKYIHKGKEYCLPRPYRNSKPENEGETIFSQNKFLVDMIVDIEKIVVHFLQYHCRIEKLAKLTLFHISRCKTIVPSNLRLAGTFFTHCTVIGTFESIDAEIPPHFDENDLISVVFHADRVREGGDTLYFDGVKKQKVGQKFYSIPFNCKAWF